MSHWVSIASFSYLTVSESETDPLLTRTRILTTRTRINVYALNLIFYLTNLIYFGKIIMRILGT